MPFDKLRDRTCPSASSGTVGQGILVEEARKYAGDPGPVVPRRLTNSEFDNTIHDITGVNIRPTASFPIDPSSDEGFNNTGEALMISPSLFKKYYAAAPRSSSYLESLIF